MNNELSIGTRVAVNHRVGTVVKEIPKQYNSYVVMWEDGTEETFLASTLRRTNEAPLLPGSEYPMGQRVLVDDEMAGVVIAFGEFFAFNKMHPRYWVLIDNRQVIEAAPGLVRPVEAEE